LVHELLARHERSAREALKKAHAPFLGLFGVLIAREAHDTIAAEIRRYKQPQAFSRRLTQYPALFAIWLAEHVMHGVGSSGHFDVYPHVRKALGTTAELSTPEREALWHAFRQALLTLGIQPLARGSGSHYMTDEYVRQAGVPLAFADDLAKEMLAHARKLGLPDEDDQEGLLTWQTALLGRLQPPFSVTARRAVERDSQAYYTRAFLRVHNNQGHATAGDVLEQKLAQAFLADDHRPLTKRAAIPQLLYRDGLLGLWLPAVNQRVQYQMRCGELTTAIRCGEEGGFRQLLGDLPPDVEVKTSSGERLLSAKLWRDRLGNRVLVFNDAGRLKATAQLGQADAVELPPGEYVALCRFEPTAPVSWQELSDDPRLVEVALSIGPGAAAEIRNGPAAVKFLGENRPTFRFDGNLKASSERTEFYFGRLAALGSVPEEWYESAQLGAFELRVNGAFGKSVALPVELNAAGEFSVELQHDFARSGISAGLQRITVELAKRGEARALHRESTLYWVGLTKVTSGLRFTYSQRPANLVTSACVGLKVTDSEASPSPDAGRIVRMTFDIGSGRLVYLTWKRPGIYVEVETVGSDGGLARSSRALGCVESVSLVQSKRIIVSASEPGTLALGDWSKFVDFSVHPATTLPASFLASRAGPGARRLVYRTGGAGAEVTLLTLSQPHVATAVTTTSVANLFETRITTIGEPTEVRLILDDLARGRTLSVQLHLDAGAWKTADFGRFEAHALPLGAQHCLYTTLDIKALGRGLWRLRFEALIGEVWGRLEDQTEGQVALTLAIDESGQEISGAAVVADVESLSPGEVIERLTFIEAHSQCCWSTLCVERLIWLGKYRSALIGRLSGDAASHLTRLVDMVVAAPPEGGRAGWVPKRSVSADQLDLFALQRSNYRRVNDRPHPLSIALRAAALLDAPGAAVFGETVHQAAACAFKNAGEIVRGSRPRSFTLTTYLEVVRHTASEEVYRLDDDSFVPRAGELLGPVHLAHAWRDLERRYESSLLVESSSRRLALATSRALRQRHGRFDGGTPEGLRDRDFVLELTPYVSDGVDDAEQQRHENLIQLGHACSWLAWACRLEVRRPGSLHSALERLASLRQTVGIEQHDVGNCVAYYLHVGTALFAYHLLLWEMALTYEPRVIRK
jgi:hypothetical protein